MPRSKPSSTTHQLDIFADSRDVMLRNDPVGVLTRHDVSAARQSLAALAARYPDDDMLAPARVLLAALVGGPPPPVGGPTTSADAADVWTARLHLQAQVAPAAAAVLGQDAGQAWLVLLWRDLARRSEPLPWSAAHADDDADDHADDHAARLRLAAGDWPQAARVFRPGC